MKPFLPWIGFRSRLFAPELCGLLLQFLASGKVPGPEISIDDAAQTV